MINFIRKIANSDELTDIIYIPENMRHKKVEVIVLPYEGEEKENIKTDLKKNVKGFLHQYANLALITFGEVRLV